MIGAARQRLGASSYQFLQTIDCWCEGRTLVLSGVVPSFYLKQVVQSLLKGIDGVERIDNRIDVVNPAGLSSVRPK